MSDRFNELVDDPSLSAGERARLRRVHDLLLTRQVTMQSLPSIRLVQENDKSLVTKINSTLVNTVPLWETMLACIRLGAVMIPACASKMKRHTSAATTVVR